MSFDKVIDSTKLNDDLTAVANSIRSKTGKKQYLSFPDDFQTEIESLKIGINTDDATATEKDIVFGKSAYIKGEKLEGKLNYLVFTGEIVSSVIGYDNYVVLACNDILKNIRNQESLSITVTFDVEPANHTIAKNYAFNKIGQMQGWYSGSTSYQYTVRYDGSATVSPNYNAYPINYSNSDFSGVGCMNLTEDGELRLYSRSVNYAIRPCNYTVEVKW